MKPLKVSFLSLLVTAAFLPLPVNATLFNRPGGMVYDSDLNITWLTDAKYARTSGFDADGIMDWNTANSWVQNLVYGSYSDWRLPTVDPGCGAMSYDCASNANEMGHLFYIELGGSAHTSISSSHNANYSLFNNIENGYFWASNEAIIGEHWLFFYDSGYTSYWGGDSSAWAVRDGDVVAAVPIPSVAWLFSCALVGLSLVNRSTWLKAYKQSR